MCIFVQDHKTEYIWLKLFFPYKILNLTVHMKFVLYEQHKNHYHKMYIIFFLCWTIYYAFKLYICPGLEIRKGKLRLKFTFASRYLIIQENWTAWILNFFSFYFSSCIWLSFRAERFRFSNLGETVFLFIALSRKFSFEPWHFHININLHG